MPAVKRHCKLRLFLWLSSPLVLVVLLVLLFRWVPPPTTSFILQASWDAWQQPQMYQPVSHNWVPYRAISPELALAVIAAEDQRFPDHFGIDTIELTHAITSDADNPRGASTITQQVAKNLFLWSGRSYLRKSLEAGLALLIEALWPKKRILEVYLNMAQFGNGIYGADAASRRIFNTRAKYLDRYQAARLAAVLPNPVVYSATDPQPHVIKRQQWIMRQMHNLGGVTYLQKISE